MTEPFVIVCVGPVPSDVTKTFSFKLMRQGFKPKIVRVSPDTLCFVEIGQEVDLCDEGGICGKWVIGDFDIKNSPGVGWINPDVVEKRARLEQSYLGPDIEDEYDSVDWVQRFFEAEHRYRVDEVAVAIYAGSLPRYGLIHGEDNLETLEWIFPEAEVAFLGQ